MAEQWRDHGWAENIIAMLIPGGHIHLVENILTGEYKKLWVADGLSVGEAIEEGGNFIDDDEIEEKVQENEPGPAGEVPEREGDAPDSELEEEPGRTDDSDGGGGGGGGGGTSSDEPLSWRDALLLVPYLLLFTRRGLIVLGITIFLILGYCADTTRTPRDTPTQVADAPPPPEKIPVYIELSNARVYTGLDNNFQPLEAATDLPINHRYGSPLREGIAIGFDFSSAIPNETRFRVEIWEPTDKFMRGYCSPNTRQWSLTSYGENYVSNAERGSFYCRYMGSMLGQGQYEARIFVDGERFQILSFTVVLPEGRSAEAGQAIGYQDTPLTPEQKYWRRIRDGQGRYADSEASPQVGRNELLRQARDRHDERMRNIDAWSIEVWPVGRNACVPTGEPCISLNRQRREKEQASYELLQIELREIRSQ